MGVYKYTNFISNIDYRITRYCLYDFLIQATPVRSLDYKTKFAFAEYDSEEDRNKSYNILNHIKLYGRSVIFQKVEPLSLITLNTTDSLDYVQNACSQYGSCRVILNKKIYMCYFRKETEMKMAISNLSKIYEIKNYGYVFNKTYKQIFKK